jgi:hypothetical protein
MYCESAECPRSEVSSTPVSKKATTLTEVESLLKPAKRQTKLARHNFSSNGDTGFVTF